MVDLDNADFDGTDATLNSTVIRSNAGHGQKANFTSLPISSEFQQVLIFLPKASY